MSEGTWRDPGERSRLVEQVISLTRALRVEQAKNRALLNPERDGVTWLAARVVELEDTIEKQNRKLMKQRRSA